MILIADSGSTKTDWCVVLNAKVIQLMYLLTRKMILVTLQQK